LGIAEAFQWSLLTALHVTKLRNMVS